MSRIEKRGKSSLKSISKASESWRKGDKPGPLTMLRLSNSLKSLEKELTNGQGIKDLRMLAKTCNDPQIVTKSVRTMLRRQGISDRFITFFESLPFYDKIMGDVMDDRGTTT